jgi:hypothetical protein
MHRIYFSSLIIIICFSIFSCSPKLAPEGHYQQTEIIADGNTNDWNLPLRFSNEKYTYQYNVTNDNNNIYICILSKDYATQTRMLKAGMTIYFDPKGEKNKNINISFPLRKADDRLNNYRSRNGNPVLPNDQKNEMNELLLQSDYYSTAGFLNIENGQFGVKNQTTNNIQVALKLNDSLLIYEAIVPIKNIIAELNPKTEKRNFSVGIALNSAPGQPDNYNNSPHSSYNGMHIRGMGGRIGGGGQHRNSEIKEEDSWYQFRLVSKKS